MKSYQVIALAISLFTAPVSAETIYRATTKIGNRMFQDVITFDQKISQYSVGSVTGTVSVPGVFSTRLVGMITAEGGQKSIRFFINATENGKTFKVDYLLKILNIGHDLRGVVRFPDKSLGEVAALRIFEE